MRILEATIADKIAIANPKLASRRDSLRPVQPRMGISAADHTLPLTRPGKVVSFRRRHTREKRMATSRTYVKSEVVGSSDKSVSDAIESAIATASRSLRNLEWFEVVDVRGSIRDNKVANYQVTLKLGLRYEPKA